MAKDKYITLVIGDREFDIDPNQTPTINYALEDEENFEQKKSAEALNIELPATINNQAGVNSAHNPSIIDMTAAGEFEKPQPARYIANGYEVLIGKFFYQGNKEKEGRVTGYRGKLYGLNGDWVIDLKEKTLYDFINPRKHDFDANTIVGSWNFDGRSEVFDYVYAPVRYQKPFGEFKTPVNPDDPTAPDDNNVLITDLKPSISIYWLLYRGFKSVGYRIKSIFMDTEFYRRSTMPWTWGGFDFIDDTRWEPLKFVAGSDPFRKTGNWSGAPDVNATINKPGYFENTPGTFAWSGPNGNPANLMVWKYPTGNLALGKVRAGLSVQLNYDWKASFGSKVEVWIEWWKNGVKIGGEMVGSHQSQTFDISARRGVEFKELFFETDVVPGDYVGARTYLFLEEPDIPATADAQITLTVEEFRLNYLKLTPGSLIDFFNYPKFKNYNWLDLLRGEIDLFDLEINTDPVRKEVIIEPRHDYEINGVTYPGYFNRQKLDYTNKVDQSIESDLELFSDYDRVFEFKFKDDAQDGGLKKVQDRNQTTIGLSKYVFPERFKAGKKDMENRFYAPTMHYEHETFKYITGIAPQLIAIIPENIANTSSDASENTFQPKRAWYKGNIAGVGGWKFNGSVQNTLPYMFAVNYKEGGQNDPVLSYSDQNIKGVIGKGLMKKFYAQRLAIVRHGRKYPSLHLRLTNSDVCNFLHRESLIIREIEFLLTHIKSYNPVGDESTEVTLWMFAPVTEKDKQASYPSIESIQNSVTANSFDVKYWHHKLLSSDIPK